MKTILKIAGYTFIIPGVFLMGIGMFVINPDKAISCLEIMADALKKEIE